MSFRNLDLNLLRVFDVIMVERSLTRAAQVLCLSQPAVSHALGRLRATLGDELLVRTQSGVAPTVRAQSLWPSVRNALAQLQDAIEPSTFDPQRDSAVFRMSMGDFLAATLMPPLVGIIESAQASVCVHLLPQRHRDPRPMLEQGEIDIAIGYFPEACIALRMHPDAPWRHHTVFESDYCCVMRRDHRLANVELTLDRFCDAHHLLISPSGRPRGAVDMSLEAAGRQRRLVLTVNHFSAAGNVVAQSDLVTTLPLSFLRALGDSKQFIVRQLPLVVEPLRIDMLWHGRQDKSPAHQWLIDQVRAAAAAVNACPIPVRAD